MSPTDAALTRYLHELHAVYVDRVDTVLEQGREDLASRLAEEYTDEALRAILTASSSAGAGGR